MKAYVIFKKVWQLAEKEAKNRACVRCGSTIHIADGIHECDQCVGLNNTQLIEFRLKLMQQRNGRTQLGKLIFLTSTLFASFLLYSALA